MYKCYYLLENEDHSARAYVFKTEEDMHKQMKERDHFPDEIKVFDKRRTLSGVMKHMFISLDYYGMITFFAPIGNEMLCNTMSKS